jgi:hypothetical protein
MFQAVLTRPDAGESAALPTVVMSGPRDNGHNIQTCESGATGQLAESASHGSSSGHSTAIGSMSTGTGDLRQRATARKTMKTWIENSLWLRKDEIEPKVGDPGVPSCALQLAERGQSIYCCFLVSEKNREGRILGYRCVEDPNSTPKRIDRAIGRERVKYGHRPFKCSRDHDPDW